MAAIAPLQAIRYPQQNQSSVVSPLTTSSPANKSKMLVPKTATTSSPSISPTSRPRKPAPAPPTKPPPTPSAYGSNASILKQDDKPAIYAYQQTYTYRGTNTYKRRGFFCRVRLEDFGPDSTIHPTNRPSPAPRKTASKLMSAPTQANLSPVFGLYDDPKNDVTDLLFEAISAGEPPKTSRLRRTPLPGPSNPSSSPSSWARPPITPSSRTSNSSWPTNTSTSPTASPPLHHTPSTTARKSPPPRGTPLDHNDPANFALFIVCIAMQDPSLIILPHPPRPPRRPPRFYLEKFCEVAETFCEVMETKFRGDSLSTRTRALQRQLRQTCHQRL